MSILRYCLDRRVLAVLGLVALALAFFAPRALGAALPFLLLAACPLSMVVMAVAMSRGSAPAARSSGVESMRTELTELAERHHRLEGELAAAETKGAR
ncbi:MAG: DUF2933 domain-containing protein [Chloroflexota bacterium]|nr:DUF2933 domain-containing protein [Chloroflexota bacterium]